MVEVKRMRPLLGTYVEIGCLGNEPYLNRAINAAFDTIAQLQTLLSFHAPDSDLTRLNQANGHVVEVHTHTVRVMKLARAMSVQSQGLFNCTVGGAMVTNQALPDHGGHASPAQGSAEDIVIKGNHIQMRAPIKVTLDGIAKGYAVDCAVATLKRHGVQSAWVNAGGDLRVYGEKVLPVYRRLEDSTMAMLGGVQNAALATSESSEVYDPALPAMIINQGSATVTGIWSVMAYRAWRADALTKVAACAQPHACRQLVHDLGGVLVKPQSEC